MADTNLFGDLGMEMLRLEGVIPTETVSDAAPEPFDRPWYEEIPVGAVRAVTETVGMVPRALSIIPGIDLTETAKSIETLGGRIQPSTGILEQGIAFVGPTVGLGAVLRFGARSIPLLRGLLTTRKLNAAGQVVREVSNSRIATAISGIFGAAEFVSTQDELRDINQSLPENDRIPEGEITTTAIVSGAAEALLERIPMEGVLEMVFREGGSGITSRAASAIARRIRAGDSKLLDYAARVAGIAAAEIPQEAATAAIQARARQAVLEERGVPTQTPGQAALSVIGPTAVSSAIFGGLAGRTRQPTPPPEPFVPTGQNAITPLEGGLPPEQARPVPVQGELFPGEQPELPFTQPEAPPPPVFPELPNYRRGAGRAESATQGELPLGPPRNVPLELFEYPRQAAARRQAQSVQAAREELNTRVDEMLTTLDSLPPEEAQAIYNQFNLRDARAVSQLADAPIESVQTAVDQIDVALRIAAARNIQLQRQFAGGQFDQPQQAAADTTQQLTERQNIRNLPESQRIEMLNEFALNTAIEQGNLIGATIEQTANVAADIYGVSVPRARQALMEASQTAPPAERAILPEFQRQAASAEDIRDLAETVVEPFLDERTSNTEIADLLRSEADRNRLHITPQQAMEAVTKAKRDLRLLRNNADRSTGRLQEAVRALQNANLPAEQRREFADRYRALEERVTSPDANKDRQLLRDVGNFLRDATRAAGPNLPGSVQEPIIEETMYNPEATPFEQVVPHTRSDAGPQAHRYAMQAIRGDDDRREGRAIITTAGARTQRVINTLKSMGLNARANAGTKGLVKVFQRTPEISVMSRLKREGVALLDRAVIKNGDRDIASLGGVIRDPRFESFMMIGLNNRNRVVGARAISERMPGEISPFTTPWHRFDVIDQLDGTVYKRTVTRQEAEAAKAMLEQASEERFKQLGYSDKPPAITIQSTESFDPKDALNQWQNWMASVGATKYYLMHNHPTGNPIPSGMNVEPNPTGPLRVYESARDIADVGVTRDIAALLPGFQGHVVINADTYAFMTIDPQTDEMVAEIKYLSEIGEEERFGGITRPLRDPRFPEALPGPEEYYGEFNKLGQVVKLAESLTYDENYVAMLYLTGAAFVSEGEIEHPVLPGKKINRRYLRGSSVLQGVELIPVSTFTNNETMRRLLAAKTSEYGADQIVSYYAGQEHLGSVTDAGEYYYAQGSLHDHMSNPTPDFNLFYSMRLEESKGADEQLGYKQIAPTGQRGGDYGRPVRETLRTRQVRPNAPMEIQTNRLLATMTDEELRAAGETVERVVPTMIEGVRADSASKQYREYSTALGFATEEMLHGATFRKLVIGKKRLQDMAWNWLVKHINADPRESNAETLAQAIAKMQKDPDFIPAPHVAAAMHFWNAMLLSDAEIKHKEGEITREQMIERRDAVIRNDFVIPTVSQYGRGLGMLHRIGDKNPGTLRFQDVIDEIQSRLGELDPARREEVMRQLEAAAAAPEPHVALYSILETMDDQTIADALWEVYYFNLLSGIPTHTTNTFATFAHILFHNAVVEPTAAIMDWAVSGIRGEARQRYLSDTLPALGALFRSIPGSFASAGRWWWSSGQRGSFLPELPPGLRASTIGRRVRQDIASMSAWRNPPSHLSPGVKKFMTTMAPFVDSATRAMLAMDVANGTLAFDAEVQRISRAEMRRTNPDATREQTEAFVKDVVENLHRFPDIQDEANRRAERLTFNDPAGRLAQMINGLRQIPVAGVFIKMLMPFSNTPDRLIARGMEFVPIIGPVGSMIMGTKGEQERLANVVKWDGWLPRINKNLPPEIMELAAKQIIGTLISLMIMSYWDDDVITGPLSTDPGIRESQLRRGMIPYAIRKGDTYYEYRRFEPMNMVVGGVTSTLTAIDEYQKQLERRGTPMTEAELGDITAMAGLAATNVMRFMIDSSYFSGVAGFFESLSKPGGVAQNFRRQMAAAVVPAGAMLRNLNRIADSEGWIDNATVGKVISRQNRNLGEALRRDVPGLAQGVAPIPFVSGEPRSTLAAPITGSVLETLISPIRGGRPQNARIENELARLDVYPRSPAKASLERYTGRRINDDVFDRYVQLRNQMFFGELRQIMSGSGYATMTDDRKRIRIRRAAARATQRARRQLGFGKRGRQAAGVL